MSPAPHSPEGVRSGEGAGSTRIGPGRTRRRRRAAGLLLACALTLTAPAALATAAHADGSSASAAPTASGKAKTVFTVGMLTDVDSLNPFTGVVQESYEMWGVSYDLLMGWSAKDFSPVPGLATSWQEAPDGKSWTYKIRSGVKWSDGQPLTAEDAAYTFNRIINGSYEQNNYGNYVANITKAEAPDPTTLVLYVKQSSPIMTHLWVPILPEHIWSKISESQVKSFSNEPSAGAPVVGSGPFRLVARQKGQYIRFEANKDYYAGAPKIDELDFKVFTNADAMAEALKRGEIDYAYGLETNVFDSLRHQPGITARSSIASNFDEISFNNGAALADGTPIGDGNPALRDKLVRQAISHAIDRNTLVQRVIGGHGSVGSSVIPPLYPQLHYTPGADAQGFDLAAAGRLLDQDGWTLGPDGVRTKGGKKLALRLFARQESKESQDTAEYVKGWLARIGIQVTVSVISEDALTEKIGQGDYDMFEWGWGVEPDPDYQLSVFTCAKRSYKDSGTVYAGLSDSFYCNPQYDALYARQATELDPATRARTVQQMQQLLYDDAGYAVTYYYDDLSAYRSDRWTGFVPQPAPNGAFLFQMGSYSYRNVHPVSVQAAAQAAAANSGSAGTVVGIGLGALVLVGGGGALLARRRRSLTADERE